MERKSIRSEALKTDEAQGIVEHLIAVCGNIDLGMDRIQPGAFTKTLVEQGLKVRVLDQHRTDSIRAAIGKPLALREVGKDALPVDVLENYPEATGGLIATTQFLMKSEDGREAFIRIAAGAIDEYSFGYDALDPTYETVEIDGKDTQVRNLNTIKLYEYGPVLWGMNQATTTISAKEAGAEKKPWDVFLQDGEYCIYRTNEDGEQLGDTLGCHPSSEEANDQLAALYATEDASADPPPDAKDLALTGERVEKEYTDTGPQQRLGDVLQGMIHKTFTMMCDSWYVEGLLDREERISLSHLIGQALDVLSLGIPEGIAKRPVYWYSSMSASAPPEDKGAALENSAGPGAGPEPVVPPPTSDMLRQIEADMREIEFLEAGP